MDRQGGTNKPPVWFTVILVLVGLACCGWCGWLLGVGH